MNPRTLLSKMERAWSHLWKSGQKRSSVLADLIRGVEETSGHARTDARAKAKAWLVAHVSTLSRGEIEVARDNFGYLLPAGWGVAAH